MVTKYGTTADTFVPGKPQLWAEKKDLGKWFDLAPDSKRFAIVQARGGQGVSTRVTFVFNFFDELRRRVPVAR
jgi:hypothetical protein